MIWLTGLTGYGIMIIAQEYHYTYGRTAEVISGDDTGVSFKVKCVGAYHSTRQWEINVHGGDNTAM